MSRLWEANGGKGAWKEQSATRRATNRDRVPIVVVRGDGHLISASAHRVLQDDRSVRVVGVARTAKQAVDLLNEVTPDVTLVFGDGVQRSLVAAVHTAHPGGKIAVIAETIDSDVLKDLLNGGVQAYYQWSEATEPLIRKLPSFLARTGGVAIGEAVRLRLQEALMGNRETNIQLTPVQQRVVDKLSEGYTEAGIAGDINSSPDSVFNVIARLKDRLDAPTLFVLAKRLFGRPSKL